MIEIEMAERITRLEGEVERNTENIKELNSRTDALYELTTSVSVITTEIKNMSQNIGGIDRKINKIEVKVDDLDNKVEEVKMNPIKLNSERWVTTVKYIGTAIGGGLLAYLLSTLLPNVFG